MADIEIRQFTPADKRMLDVFARFPRKLYHRDRYWVPELVFERKQIHQPKHNPELEQMDVAMFLAMRDGEPVGRITGHINHRHNEVHHETIGFFGFFECENDPGAAQHLFQAAESFLREKGCTAMRGPANYSSNQEWGMLVDGRFEDPPMMMMLYNPRYYVRLMEREGFVKAADLLAYEINNLAWPNDKIQRVSRIAEKRYRVTTRALRLDRKHFDREVDIVLRIYNASWEQNWGFVPLTRREFEHLAKQLRPILHEKMARIAEVDGEPVGVSISLPDVHQMLMEVQGKLGRLVWAVLRKKWHDWGGTVTRARVALMGVIPEYRGRGIEALFYKEAFELAVGAGVNTSEIGWVLEDNVEMNNAAIMMGALPYKRYRIWERPITPETPAAPTDEQGTSAQVKADAPEAETSATA